MKSNKAKSKTIMVWDVILHCWEMSMGKGKMRKKRKKGCSVYFNAWDV